MVSGTVLGVIVGLLGALATLGVPLAAFLYRLDKRARRSVRLLTGEDEVDGDGVIPRLSDVEDQARRHERALRHEDALPLTDGGPDQDDG